MTCKEIREKQLDELKSENDIAELTYCIEILGYGNFSIQERLTFETLQEAREEYNKLVKPRGPYYPGFIRCYAKVPFSGRL